MATGLARGAAKRGKRIAFGDGKRIIWDHNSEPIFRGNPNIAPPRTQIVGDLEWIRFYKGSRIYNSQDTVNHRWNWNYDFHAIPGEVFLSHEEKRFAGLFMRGLVIIEPNAPAYKVSTSNKQWPYERYDELSRRLRAAGHTVAQFVYNGAKHRLALVTQIRTPTFREALAVMATASLYIGSEGGLHHGAAAVGTPAVVLFGGFVPPSVTGYAMHTNLTGGAEACGSLRPCEHCAAAMQAITVDEVYAAAIAHLEKRSA